AVPGEKSPRRNFQPGASCEQHNRLRRPRIPYREKGERKRNQIIGRSSRSREATSRRLHQNRDRRRSQADRTRRITSRRRSPRASGKLRHFFTAKIAVNAGGALADLL